MVEWRKIDPFTLKKKPVTVDIPEFLSKIWSEDGALEIVKAVGDFTLFDFYDLLLIGEYTMKMTINETKQTFQFRIESVTLFKKDRQGTLRQLPINASDADILSGDGETLRIENQKNGWKNVCVYQEHNDNEYYSPVPALSCRYLHIHSHSADQKTPLSAYWENGQRNNVKAENISKSRKFATLQLDYPGTGGIPIEEIDTHSLRSSGTNALALNGFLDREIQNMLRWRSTKLMEYIREVLTCFAQVM